MLSRGRDAMNRPMVGGKSAYLAGVLVLLICIGLAVPESFGARGEREQLHQAVRTASLSQVVTAGSALVRRLQVERGTGAIYLGDPSAPNERSLRAAYGSSDAALRQWESRVAAAGAVVSAPQLGTVRHTLAGLPAHRIATLSLAVTSGAQFTWYSGRVSDLIAVIARIVRQGATSGQASEYLSLLATTEEIGRERGKIAGMLAAGTAAGRPAVLEVTARMAARQADLANVALLGTSIDPKVLAEIDSGHSARYLRQVEQYILRQDAAALRAIAPATWFTQVTQYLGRYAALIEALDTSRQQAADRAVRASRSSARWSMLLAVATFALALLVGIGVLVATWGQIRRRRTSQESYEREIISRELMLRGILSNSRTIIYVKDLQGRYLMANEPFLRLFSLTEDELIGQDDFFVDAQLAPLWQANDRQAQRGEYCGEEWTDGPDGRLFYDTVKFPLLDAAGVMYGICGISTDVTDQRRAIEAMAEAARLAEAASAAKSAFLATMSHEIRTPMNAVIGMTDLLLGTDLDPQQREYAETVRTGGDSLLAVINNILDFSRFEAGEMSLEQVPFDLRQCVEESLSLIAPIAAGLDLVAELAPDCPQLVRGDGSKLRQVLVNLVGNAAKFTERGEIHLRVAVTPPAPAPSESTARTPEMPVSLTFSVRDTGIGIPADRMDRLFKSFSQVDDSTTRVYGGSGLGLAISRAIVQAMGGDISVISDVGAGSTFSFTVALAAVNPEPSVRAPMTSLVGVRVLVVDDNATSRRVLGELLRSWGATGLDAGGAQAALDLLGARPGPDLVIIDQDMPDVDGWELARRIRERPTGANLPLILLSSLTSPAATGSTLVNGVSTKPVRAVTLQQLIGDLLAEPRSTVAAMAAPPIPAPRSESRLRILLAEDNHTNQKVAQGILGRLGHAIDIADDGDEALDALRRNDYDVVLMDIHMPNRDGLETTRAIREQFAAERQPYIVAMTASSLPEDRKACVEAGMNGYLLKPVRAADVAEALASVPFGATIGGRRPAGSIGIEAAGFEAAGIEDGGVEYVDLAALNDLLESIGADAPPERQEMITSYLGQADQWIADLGAAIAVPDRDVIRGVAHTLGSSSALLGAHRLAACLADLEAQARDGAGPDLAPGVRTALAVYATTARIFRGLLEPAGPTRG